MLRTFNAPCVLLLVASAALACGCSSTDDNLNRQLHEAVVKQNVADVQKLLSDGAVPSALVDGKTSALGTAFEILIDKAPPDAEDAKVVILFLMTKSIRHRDGKAIEVSGSLRPKLRGGAGTSGFTVDGFELTKSDGTTHAVAITAGETKFSNVEHSQRQFPVNFKVLYTISGVLMNGVLEAEEISAPAQPTSNEPAEGIVVPLAVMLPSTMDLYRPVLKKRGFLKG